ncbi:hypothetical protein EC988_007663 [Linderina pennispora]|nr:hypothetical protein EC988_007663 [Linderina pennispora]
MVANRFKLGERGWSCAWDPIDPNVCYVGTAKGLVQMFDIRKPSLAVHVWDGPASGARLLRPAVNSNGKIITGCSPIHSIAVVPSSQCSRLLVANSLHVYSLPTPEFKLGLADSSAAKTSNEWIRLTDSEAHNNPCYSVSFDPRQSLAAASFRSPGGSSRRQETIHEMFDVEFGKDSQVSWNRRHQINVESWQSKMTRSTIFSYYAEPPYNRWQSLMCAGIERSRQVKVWDGSAAQAKELVSLSDVPATEYVVDIKGCQWGLSDTGNQKTTLATLTNSTVRLYDIR